MLPSQMAADHVETLGPVGGGPTGPHDGQLVEALMARGQSARAALETLYERYAPHVCGYLEAQLGPGERAEAALVQTFALLWERPSAAPRGGDGLRRWLLLRAHQLVGPIERAVTPSCSDGASPAEATGRARLEDVLITEQLARRPGRPPDFRAENAAFFRIARLLSDHASPAEVFQTLVDTATELCDAGTAGLSLLEAPPPGDDDDREKDACFRWTHMAGALAMAVGGTTPRSFSPCGVTLDRGTPQLFAHPARYFDYLAAAPAPIVEGLVIPLAAAANQDAAAIGTIWVVSHDPNDRPFDWEDARIMMSLANFTAIALQICGGRAGASASSAVSAPTATPSSAAPPGA